MVWFAYHLESGGSSEYIKLSLESLVEKTGYTLNTVVTARAWLTRNGWLRRESQAQSKGARGRFSVDGYCPEISQIQLDARPTKQATSGYIYLITSDRLTLTGLVGYIGQTIGKEARSRISNHLSGEDLSSKNLIATIEARGCSAISEIIQGGVELGRLDEEEVRWATIYRESGWTLWNKKDLVKIGGA